MVLNLPRLHQHEEIAEEGGAWGHPHEHLAEVDEDGHLEDGVGREVLKLEAELLQQQQEERRDRQRQPTEEVGDEEHELPGALHPSRLRTRLSAPQTGNARDDLAKPWQLRRCKAEEREGKGVQRSTKSKGRGRLEENAKG